VSGDLPPRAGAVSIGARWVGRGLPVYLVAAAGRRHDDDVQLGYKLIETAGAAGADAVLLQKGGLSDRYVKSLFGHAHQVGLTALGQPADERELDLFASLDVPGLRIAWRDSDHRVPIERIVEIGSPVLFSLEPCSRALEEALEISERAGGAPIAIVAEDEPELLARLTRALPERPVGYAHVGREGAALGSALALGACLIEAPHELSDGGAGLKAAAARVRAWRQPRAEASAEGGGH